jgi:hypothetical protein
MTKSQRKKLNRAKNIRKQTNVQRNQKKIVAREVPAFFEDNKELINQIMNEQCLHEKDFIAHDCILCGNKVNNIHDSHNPFPLAGVKIELHTAENENGKEVPVRCCSECNKSKVVPKRLNINMVFKFK